MIRYWPAVSTRSNQATPDYMSANEWKLVQQVSWYEWSTLKSGKQGKALKWMFADYCPLVTCQLCMKTGSTKSIRPRDVWGWNREHKDDYEAMKRDVLCMSCYNKVRPIVKKSRELEECRKLINRITKEIQNERRKIDENSKHGTVAVVSGGSDGASDSR